MLKRYKITYFNEIYFFMKVIKKTLYEVNIMYILYFIFSLLFFI